MPASDLFTHDLRLALRGLLRRPGQAIAAVLTLGLGIAAAAGIFAVVHGVLLAPLGYADPDRLVVVHHESPANAPDYPTTTSAFHVWRSAESLDDLAGWHVKRVNALGTEGPERLVGAVTVGPFFEILGVPLQAGRGPHLRDDHPAADPVVVLTRSAAERLLLPDQPTLGQTLRLDGQSYTVIGIAPPGFAYPAPDFDFWAPSRYPADDRNYQWIHPVGRLAEGADLAQVKSEIDTLMAQRRLGDPNAYDASPVHVEPLADHLVGGAASRLWMLFAAAALVLALIAANLAHLQLVRATSQRDELAVRRALGAGRFDLARRQLLESLTLAGFGAALGIVLARPAERLVLAFLGSDLPRAAERQAGGWMPEPWIVLWALIAALGTGLLAAALPAWRASHLGQIKAILHGAASRGSRRHDWPHHALVVSQAALAVILLVAAGLLWRSFREMLTVDPGFDPSGGLICRLEVPIDARNRYDRLEDPGPGRFFDTFSDRLAALPGVSAVARSSQLPLHGSPGTGRLLEVRGQPPRDEPLLVLLRVIGPSYTETVGQRLRHGRELRPEDHRDDAPPMVLINTSLARILAASRATEDALGLRVAQVVDPGEYPVIPRWSTVAGVVDDAHDISFEADPMPAIYISSQRAPGWPSFFFLLRTQAEDPLALAPSVRGALAELDGRLALDTVETLDQRLDRHLAGRRALLRLVAVFAGLALALAALGLFAVTSYLVGERTRELAIRRALGADTAKLRRSVVFLGLKQATLGLALGLAGVLALGRILEGLLFGVRPGDPLTLAAVAALVLGVVALAAWLPAARASRSQPMDVLRHE